MAVALETVMLPPDVAAELRAKIDGERYKSESDVVRESLAALRQRDGDFEAWLEEVAYPAHDDILAHPEKGRTPEQVRTRIAEELHRLKNRP